MKTTTKSVRRIAEHAKNSFGTGVFLSKTEAAELAAAALAVKALADAFDNTITDLSPYVCDENSCECGENGNGFDDDGKPCDHIKARRAAAEARKLAPS